MSKGDRMCNLDNTRELNRGAKRRGWRRRKIILEKTGELPEEDAGYESWDDDQRPRHWSRRWLMEIPKGTRVTKTPWSRVDLAEGDGEGGREGGGGEASRHLS